MWIVSKRRIDRNAQNGNGKTGLGRGRNRDRIERERVGIIPVTLVPGWDPANLRWKVAVPPATCFSVRPGQALCSSFHMHKALVRVTSSSSVYAIDAFVHRTMSIVIVRPSVCAVCLPNRYSLFFLFRRLPSPPSSPSPLEASNERCTFMPLWREFSPLSSSPLLFFPRSRGFRWGGRRIPQDLASFFLSFHSTKGEFFSISSWSRTLLLRLVYNRTVYIYMDLVGG